MADKEPAPLIGLPKSPNRRVSSDSAWPIRRADGSTPAQVRQAYAPAKQPRRPLQPMQQPRRGLLARIVGRG